MDEAEKEVEKDMGLDDIDDDEFDDDDDDFEKVEKLTLPLVSRWIFPSDGLPIYGLEVPVMKEDVFIHDSMYRNDIVFGPRKDPPPHVFDPTTKPAPPPAHVCSICFKHWTILHHFCCLPCGHIFGAPCIQKWLQTNSRGTCPQCNILCSLEDARPLYATPLRIPAADKSVADQKISTRRFPFTKQGIVTFRKFEIGRRNFALKKRSDAKKRLAGVVGRKNDLMKRRTDLLDRMASVLNRANALEQRGGSLCRADALGRWADEYLRRAKACEEKAKALSQRARAYNQRVKAFEVRLHYFSRRYDDLQKNTTHCAAPNKMNKEGHKSPLVDFDEAKNEKEEEEEQVQVMELDQDEEDEEEESMDLNVETEEDIEEEEEEEEEEEQDEEEEDVYKDLVLLPEVTSWFDDVTGKTDQGIQVMNVRLSTDSKRYEFDLCPICLKPWTLDKIHQMCCLPCGHMFGMSCIKQWIEDRSRDKCPQCYKLFSLESVRLLYATRLCIPAAADQKASIRRFSFSKKGFTTFKQYERELRTNALNNRSDVLKQRVDVLGRQNDAMKRRTELLNRMANAEKRADVLERQNDAMKRQTELLNRVTDEEEWAEASEQHADAETRVEALRRRADALGQRADEYLRMADAFGQQAKALRQEAKALRQLVDSYLASKKFYKQSYKEFLGLHDKMITE